MTFKVRSTIALPLALCVLGSLPLTMQAQDEGRDGPPKVLVIQREFTKPGKGGALHEKTEGAFLAAAKAGKAPFHYFAMTSLSGPDRALFFSGYPSFAAWSEERKSMSEALGAVMDRAMVPDGDLLSQTDSSVWTLREDLSLHTGSLQGVRYMEIQQFMVKPGHANEWSELAKMYVDGFKNMPEANWATFEQMYGTNGGGFITVSTLKSLADVDKEMLDGESFGKSLDKDQRKKMRELEAACIESTQENLFAISPKMSLPIESWVKADPDFWKPKAAPVKKAAAKPAP